MYHLFIKEEKYHTLFFIKNEILDKIILFDGVSFRFENDYDLKLSAFRKHQFVFNTLIDIRYDEDLSEFSVITSEGIIYIYMSPTNWGSEQSMQIIKKGETTQKEYDNYLKEFYNEQVHYPFLDLNQ